MKLSEQQEYLVAIPAAAAGDYSTARQKLKILISRAQDEGDKITTCYLLQRLGDVEAETGNTELAQTLHEQALDIDGGTPHSLFEYAKSLFHKFIRPDLALLRLSELEKLLWSEHWKPSEDDLSREWYLRNSADLRQQIKEIKRQKDRDGF